MNMRDELKAFVDNELSEERRTEILRRLETDSELQAEVIELRQMSRVIREEAWQPEPVGLENTLAALSRPRHKKPWWYGPQVGWALGAASLAALAICFFPRSSGGQADGAEVAMSASFKRDEATASKSVAESPAAPPTFGNAAAQAPTTMDLDARRVQPEKNSHESQRPPTGAAPQIQNKNQSVVEVSPGARSAAGTLKVLEDKNEKVVKEKPGVRLGYMSNVYIPDIPSQSLSLELEVEDVKHAQAKVQDIAKNAKAKVLKPESKLQSRPLSSQMTLKVPASKFATVYQQINGLGHSVKPNVSEDYPNLSDANASSGVFLPKSPEAQAQDRKMTDTPIVGKPPAVSRARLKDDPDGTLNLTIVEKARAPQGVHYGDFNGSDQFMAKAGKQASPVSPVTSPEPPAEESPAFDPKYALLILPALFLAWVAARLLRR